MTQYKELGRGGMGIAYLYRNPELGRDEVVKTLTELDEEALHRFSIEARAMAAVTPHPNIVTIFRLTTLNRLPCIIMEYVPGEELKQRIPEAGYPFDNALSLFRTILLGMKKLHEHGLIHRDLKPGNVMVSSETEQCKVMDLGLALDRESRERLTRDGDMLGTMLFMAPEQVEGKLDLTPAADVYALGKILFNMLTGVILHKSLGSPVKIASSVMRGILPEEFEAELERRDTPDAIREFMRRALSPKPEQRFANAGEMLAALDAYFKQVEREKRNEEVRRAAETRRSRKQAKLSWMLTALIGVALLLTAGIAYVAYQQRRAAETAAREKAQRLKAEEQARKQTQQRLEAEKEQEAISRLMAGAHSAFRRSEWSAARDNLEQVLEKDPKHHEAQILLAEVLSLLESPERVAIYERLADQAEGQQKQDYLLLALFGIETYMLEGREALLARLDKVKHLIGQLAGDNKPLGECIGLFYRSRAELLKNGETSRHETLVDRYVQKGLALARRRSEWSSWVQMYCLASMISERAPERALELIRKAAAINPDFHMVLNYRQEIRRLITIRKIEGVRDDPPSLRKFQEIGRCIGHLISAIQDLERLQVLKPDAPLIDLRHAQNLTTLAGLETGQKRRNLLDRAETFLDECRPKLSDPLFKGYAKQFRQAERDIEATRRR